MTHLPFLLPLAALLAAPVAWRGLTHSETPMHTALAESLFLAVLAVVGYITGRIHSRAEPADVTELRAQITGLEETVAEQRRIIAGQMRPAAPTCLYDHQEAGL